VKPRLRSLHDSTETFARGGASAQVQGNTMEAFELALRLGAGGLDSTVWVTADGWPVLSDHGSVGPRLRRRAIRTLAEAELPANVPSLEDLYRRLGPTFSLSLDVPDQATFVAVIETARQAGPGAEDRLWLCSPQIETLTSWRPATSAKLVNSIRLSSLKRSPEQRVAQLAERAIDGLSLHHTEWSPGLIALTHRFERYALAREATHERELATVVDAGIDGVSCRHVDRMAAVAALYYPDT
jgi:glycerophosphoryl diester phosphodiesterase